MLIAGALCYIGWHVLGMALRTPGLASRVLGSMPANPGGLAG
jgi:hypothetical protein